MSALKNFNDLFSLHENIDTLLESIKSDTSGFEHLRDIIAKLTGIYFAESKKYLLEGRITKRLKFLNLNTLEEYVDYIKQPKNWRELTELYATITINETYFYRSEFHLYELENTIIPDIIDSKETIATEINLWSAACSTGEEAYTIAIIVKEKLQPKFPNIKFNILASDINYAVLDHAAIGKYNEYDIRYVPSEILDKYFTRQDKVYILSDEIKNMVKFDLINLYDQQSIKKQANSDVIFCSNVLIYFNNEAKQKVVNFLYNNLNPNGYLCVGYSESLHGITKSFKHIHLPKIMVYKKSEV